MHKILFLNDFSDNSATALRYAALLAEVHGAVLSQVACHADAVLPLHRMPERPDELAASLQAFCTGLEFNGEIEHLGIWLENASAVCTFAEDIRAGLLVAPESGPYSVGLAHALARTSNLPLLLIPASAVFKPIQKIVFAVSFQFNDLLALNMLRRWVQLLGAKLDMVHVPEAENQVEAAAEKMGALAEMLSGGLPFAFQLLKVGDPGKVLLDYLARENAGMLALTTHRRSAWKSFFESSTSEYLFRQCPAPLLLIKDMEDTI
jgi:nucleotide-binding universal stress UspA family protein